MPRAPKEKKAEGEAPSARRSDADEIRAQAIAAEDKE